MSFKKLKIGLNLIGCIKEINALDLAVSLPNSLTGFVSIAHISSIVTNLAEKAAEDDEAELPELNELFHIGQFVIVTVIELTEKSDSNGKRKIELSMNPELI